VVDAVDDVQHRALACAIGADDRAHFVLAHVERDVGQCFHSAERERHALDREHGLADRMPAVHAALRAAAAGKVFASRTLRSAEIDPVRPSSYFTCASTCTLLLPS